MNRRQWQNLARVRLREAKTLLAAGESDSVYYLAGCAVEYALKACIAQSFLRHTWPDKRFVQNIHIHDLERLVELAGLRPQLEKQFRDEWHFRSHWDIVRQWDNESRFRSWEHAEASSLYQAVAHAKHGVHRWITRHW